MSWKTTGRDVENRRRGAPHLTVEVAELRRKEIVNLYERGAATSKQLARRFDMTKGAVIQILRCAQARWASR